MGERDWVPCSGRSLNRAMRVQAPRSVVTGDAGTSCCARWRTGSRSGGVRRVLDHRVQHPGDPPDGRVDSDAGAAGGAGVARPDDADLLRDDPAFRLRCPRDEARHPGGAGDGPHAGRAGLAADPVPDAGDAGSATTAASCATPSPSGALPGISQCTGSGTRSPSTSTPTPIESTVRSSGRLQRAPPQGVLPPPGRLHRHGDLLGVRLRRATSTPPTACGLPHAAAPS